MLLILAETIALIVCFFFYDDLRFVFAAAGITFVVLFWGYVSAHATLKNELEIRFFSVTAEVLGKVVTAMLLLVLIVWIPQAHGEGLFMPRADFRTIFNWTAGYVGNFYPGVALTGSYGGFAKSFVAQQLASQSVYQSMSITQQAAATDAASVQLSSEIAKATGSAPAANETMSDVVYDYIVAVLVGMQQNMNDQFVIGWIVVLFLVLRALGIVAVWALQLVVLIFYELLLAIGFMHIDEAVQTKETVVY
jgi:hypothetical protein